MRYIGFWIVAIVLAACSNSPDSGWKEVNLIDHGIPLTIKAPENLEVERSKLAFQEDITIKGENGYDLQVFVSDAIVNSTEAAIQNHKELVSDNPFFSKYIQEDADGFIYQNQLDSTYTSFGFRYVKLMGGKEYVFQEAMMGTFEEEQIKAMYEGVRNK
jgi:hypothetical protein